MPDSRVVSLSLPCPSWALPSQFASPVSGLVAGDRESVPRAAVTWVEGPSDPAVVRGLLRARAVAGGGVVSFLSSRSGVQPTEALAQEKRVRNNET